MGDSVPKHTGPNSLTDTHPRTERLQNPTHHQRESPEMEKLVHQRCSSCLPIQLFGVEIHSLLSPGPGLVGTTKVYSGVGADIVMESLRSSTVGPILSEWLRPDFVQLSAKRAGGSRCPFISSSATDSSRGARSSNPPEARLF